MMPKRNKLILNIPHSSMNGLETVRWNSMMSLSEVVMRWTDWHTNIIFFPDRDIFNVDKDFSIHVFHKSRFVVDAERLINDEMEAIGQGIIYTHFGEKLERSIDESECQVLMNEYHKYHNDLEQSVQESDTNGIRPIIIDCHSFPSELSETDVCIGFNDDFSRPSDEILTGVIRIFNNNGFKVGVNEPYSNSIQPVKKSELLKTSYCSFMIELNKNTYLQPSTIILDPAHRKIKAAINEVYRFLLDTNP